MNEGKLKSLLADFVTYVLRLKFPLLIINLIQRTAQVPVLSIAMFHNNSISVLSFALFHNISIFVLSIALFHINLNVSQGNVALNVFFQFNAVLPTFVMHNDFP